MDIDKMIAILEHIKKHNPNTYMNNKIVVEVEGNGIGGIDCVEVKDIFKGFDWDSGKIIITTKQKIAKIK